MALAFWIQNLFYSIPITLLLLTTPFLFTPTITCSVFIRENINSSHVYNKIVTSYTSVVSDVECTRECLKEPLCSGFYYDSVSKSCYMTKSEVDLTPDHRLLNSSELVVYRQNITRTCPTTDGFQEVTINGKIYCFLVVIDRLTFYDASQDCQDRGAQLFHFDDDPDKLAKLPEIMNLFGINDLTCCWIGLHSPDKDSNVWQWDYNQRNISASELTSLPWVYFYSYDGTRCAEARVGNPLNVQIKDKDCTGVDEYVCEYILT